MEIERTQEETVNSQIISNLIQEELLNQSSDSNASFNHLEIEFEREEGRDAYEDVENQELQENFIEGWHEVSEIELPLRKQTFNFEPQCCFDQNFTPENLFYILFDGMFDHLVEETNKYAQDRINEKQDTTYLEDYKCSRLHRWRMIDKQEIKRFFGLVMIIAVQKKENIKGIFSIYTILIIVKIFGVIQTLLLNLSSLP